MTDFAVFWDWLSFVLRWGHVGAAVAWVGASFYFLSRELHLRRSPDLPEGAVGEQWQIHGGGYFHIVKYGVAPPGAPEGLGMFKWESYFTWATGFLLLGVVYYAQADLLLVDAGKAPMPGWAAVALSVLSLAGGWLVYDGICKAMIARPAWMLDGLLVVAMTAAAWGYGEVFAGRAALLHLGALLATIMSANVFFVVVPNGQRGIAALRAGRAPDPADRAKTKQRGAHNRYLYLPVIALMLSVHYPLAFGTGWSWVSPALILAIGVLVRRAFDRLHAGQGMPAWPWAAAAILVLLLMWISSDAAPVLPQAAARAEDPRLAAVAEVVAVRCAMCHAAEPVWAGLGQPPGHVLLETPAQVAAQGRAVYLQSGLSAAMPPGNVTGMTEAERALVAAWWREAGGR